MALSDDNRVKDLTNNGSSCISKGTNGYTFYQNNTDDGEIVSKLIKPTYNEDELKKAVDVAVTELITESPTQRLDLVPRPVYNDALTQIENLSEQVESQSVEIGNLNSRVSELEAISSSLLIDIDAERLVASTSQNQANTINERYVSTVNDFQNALQKATLEAIERVSLKAQVDGLTAQKESLIVQLSNSEQQVSILQDQLFGKQAQTSKGATESNDGSFTYRVVTSTQPENEKLLVRGPSNKDNKGYTQASWINGPAIEIYNAKTIDIIDVQFIKIQQADSNLTWLNTPTSQRVAAGEKKTFSVSINQSGYANLQPKRDTSGVFNSWDGNNKDHRGILNIKVTWTDGTTDTLSGITVRLRKVREL